MKNADAWRAASPWHPMHKELDLKVIGKLLEELGECVTALHESNQDDQRDEIADVHVNIYLVDEHFKLGVSLTPEQGRYGTSSTALVKADLGRAIAAASRCLIQGIDECEPVTGKPNRDWLRESLDAVIASTNSYIRFYKMNRHEMAVRMSRKLTHLKSWHEMPPRPFFIMVARGDHEVSAECSCGAFKVSRPWRDSIEFDALVHEHERYHEFKHGTDKFDAQNQQAKT